MDYVKEGKRVSCGWLAHTWTWAKSVRRCSLDQRFRSQFPSRPRAGAWLYAYWRAREVRRTWFHRSGSPTRGAFTVLNHPARWNDDPEHVVNDANLSLCDGLEVYSGARVSKGAEGAVAAPLWEACLGYGLRFFALGSSDCHTYDFAAPSRPTNGWTVLWLEELTQAAVFAALRAGRFYASSGLEVDEICVEGGCIRVEASQAERIRFTHSFRWKLRKLLSEAAGSAASYEPRASDGYVRVEVDGKGTPSPGAGVPI
jgi:hypothetical protein